MTFVRINWGNKRSFDETILPLLLELVVDQNDQLKLGLGHLLGLHLLLLFVAGDDEHVRLDVDGDRDHEEPGSLGREVSGLQVNVSLLTEAVLGDRRIR